MNFTLVWLLIAQNHVEGLESTNIQGTYTSEPMCREAAKTYSDLYHGVATYTCQQQVVQGR